LLILEASGAFLGFSQQVRQELYLVCGWPSYARMPGFFKSDGSHLAADRSVVCHAAQARRRCLLVATRSCCSSERVGVLDVAARVVPALRPRAGSPPWRGASPIEPRVVGRAAPPIARAAVRSAQTPVTPRDPCSRSSIPLSTFISAAVRRPKIRPVTLGPPERF